ncbi:uncharacterized protein LOC131058395 isoform X1 [Cryptomeria japonica]|uniref:uncharacterized protein LOC131058395 isoform X1 n=1 Tax=Cryptomeria japonica TaxID=3369 RepID=UPI0027DAB284|nr:uncharacterized protein LOC131058395 isoform X1 [Cryptomeria japonica]
MLPRYPTDRIVLLEVTRQLAAYAKAFRHRHGNGVPVPIILGNSVEVCPNALAMDDAEKELALYSFSSFALRESFDPHGYIEETVGRKFKHEFQIEDFMMNLLDDLEVKRKMHSRLPLDFIRKCKIYTVADQAQDSGRHLQSSYDRESKSVRLDWNEPEVVDLDALMASVLSCTRRWVDVQHQKLREQGIAMTFTLEEKPAEGGASVSEGNPNPRNTSEGNLRSASEGNLHPRGSKRKERPEKRESSKKKQEANRDRSSGTSSRQEKRTSEIEESMESMVQNDKEGQAPRRSPGGSLQDNELHDDREDNEVTSPPREEELLKEIQVKETRSAIPDWLKERLTKVIVIEDEDNVIDLESLVGHSQEVIEKRKATKMSKMIRDETGSRILQIATPAVDKYEGEILAEEYDVETFELGPLTAEQTLDDATDSFEALKDKLREEMEKNRKLEREVGAWRTYFSHLNQPLGRQDPARSPVQALPLQSISEAERFRSLVQHMSTWMDKSHTVAVEFATRMMKTIHRAIQVLEIIHNLMITVAAFAHTKEVIILVLQVIRQTSRKVLAQEKIMDGGPHSLLQWSTLLQMKEVLFEDISTRCSHVEEVIHPIQDKVFEVLRTILGRRIEIETDVDLQELEDRIKVIFCKDANVITDEQRDRMFATMLLIEKTKELEPGWDAALLQAFDQVIHLEERMKNLPEIPIAEIEGIVSRFIAYAKKEHWKGNKILDERLL